MNSVTSLPLPQANVRTRRISSVFFISVVSTGALQLASRFTIPSFLTPPQALAFYEHAITLDLEVSQIWRRHISGATILFILTRYLILLDRIFAVIGLWQLHYLDVRPLPITK